MTTIVVLDTKRDMAKHHFGTRLKELREERGLTAAALSREAGVGQTTITLIEQGKRSGVNLETLLDIAIALSKHAPVTLDDLVGYDASRYYTQETSRAATISELIEVQQGLFEVQRGLRDLPQLLEAGFRAMQQQIREDFADRQPPANDPGSGEGPRRKR